MRREVRGQATTELALGSLVFVTVLLYGIHFGEAGFAMLKAKEAAAFAMHAASGSRTHLFSLQKVTRFNTYSPFDPVAAGAAAQTRYAPDRHDNGVFRNGVLTQIAALTVGCRADDTVTFGLKPSFALNGDGAAALDYLSKVYQAQGGVACLAETTLSLFRVPTSFAQGSLGFFRAAHLSYTSIPVCGAGFATHGNCSGRLATLTGDWAFEDQIGSEINNDVPHVHPPNPSSPPNQINNHPYEQVVHQLFLNAGGQYAESSNATPSQEMMRIAAGVDATHTPGLFMDETGFNMSYLGERGSGAVNVPDRKVAPSYNPDLEYQTSGADMDNSKVDWDKTSGQVNGVPRCFMSMYGCSGYPTNPN
jgi:hypothetical protein